MPTFHVLIFANPVAGQDEAFADWYENTHLDEVLATAGFRAAQRFDLELQVGLEQPNRHLAVYETEGESAEEVLSRLNSTRDQRDMSGPIDGSQLAMWVYTPAGARHEL